MANWYDDLLDGASNLASKASFDNVFGATPESGSLMDIGQSLLNPNYDPEGTLIGRVLREAPPPDMSDILNNPDNPNETSPNPVDRTNEPDPEPFVPSEYTMRMPAKMSMDIAGVPRKREVGMVGGKPRMQLNANTEEEEEMARLAQYLRNRG
tara:strand:+ start:77 stop:535 length:459 start_codon:yes stop_codon:yes gene_type:complete